MIRHACALALLCSLAAVAPAFAVKTTFSQIPHAPKGISATLDVPGFSTPAKHATIYEQTRVADGCETHQSVTITASFAKANGALLKHRRYASTDVRALVPPAAARVFGGERRIRVRATTRSGKHVRAEGIYGLYAIQEKFLDVYHGAMLVRVPLTRREERRRRGGITRRADLVVLWELETEPDQQLPTAGRDPLWPVCIARLQAGRPYVPRDYMLHVARSVHLDQG
jgi:hypothetical protein